MKKRILGVILVLCLLFAFLPSSLPTAQAYSDTDIIFPVEGGNLYFDKSSGTITDCDETVTSANIPSEIDSVAVTSIGKLAFYSCSSLTSVTIPNSVTSIGDYAFYSCSSLTSVSMPDSVTYIGSGAFDDTAIYNAEEQWVDNVLYIGKLLIKAKEDIIGEYSIRQGTVGIAGEGFLGCCNLTSVTIPNSVISIGDRAFFATSLTNVIIPDSVTSIGHQAFSYCSNLTGIWVDEGNISYCNDEFGVLFDAEKKTLLQVPGAISGEYEVPNGVTSISHVSFLGCSSLTSVAIPSSVTNIGAGTFSGCSNLTGIWVDEGNISYCNDEFGVLFDAGKKTLLQAPCGISGEYTIPNGVTSIDEEAFENCSNLTGVEIPDGVTSIGFLALSGTGLTSVTIPASVTSIGNYAFYDCINLTSVYFMGNAPALGKCAFQMWDYEEGTDANIPWLTLYYIEGKEGWTSPTWNGYPTATWTPPHEHAYTDIVTSPTCTEQGYTMHICECGDSYIDTYTDALGHDFGDWTQTKAPTCTEKGDEKRTCSRCGAYETREVASTGHTEVIDPAVP
ncbi:MAG: leucine-rich repeat domain-containing protein, partial [Faecousia sp.]